MMQAAVYKKFNEPIEILTVPRPKLTAPTSVIVQVMATGVCRSDWHGWKGHDDDIKNHGFPFIPGHELSGVIVETGRFVKKLKKGDPVAIPFDTKAAPGWWHQPSRSSVLGLYLGTLLCPP